MSGIRNGDAKCIQDEEPRAVFTHCYGHALSPAAGDTIRMNTIMESSLQATHEITKLMKYSPRREALFHEIQLQDDNAPGTQSVVVRALCPMWWTIREDSMESIIWNYSTLQLLWDQAVDLIRDKETTAHIRGVASQMKSFNYFFGLVPGEVLLRHTDNLSRTLQKNISAPEEGGLKTVCTLFRSDLHAANLRSQLEILSNNFSSSSGDTVEVPPFHMDTVKRFSAFTWATYPVLNPVIMTLTRFRT